MYHHQAMKEPDAAHFKVAMKKEVKDQLENGNFRIVRRSDIPKNVTVFPSVWQMKRKRDIRTRKVKKYKARMNFDGSKMLPGKHYDPNRVYAPVASWNSIRLQLILTVIFGWTTRQIDYVLAFPQAPVDRDIYMEIPRGFEIEGARRGEYVLQLKRNVYGQKQAGRVWNDYLHQKLTKELNFVQSKHDECVYFRGRVMYVLYTDDSILAGPDGDEVKKAIEDIKQAGLDITVEGNLQDFLGVNIERKDDRTIHLTQPHLIDQILEDLKLTGENVTTKSTPAQSSTVLRKHEESPPFDEHFNYRSVIGKLNYLERGSRPDIAYIVHQCARFTADPRVEHGAALKWLGRYLKGTRDKGLILKPSMDKDMEVFVDADFAGNWNPEEGDKRDTARSRHGYFITYAGVPISWKSQLQGEICLSSTESEYTGLSHALREAIPIMEMIKEMKALGFSIRSETPKVHCKVFEDNSGALEMAKIHKYRPRTKHICTKLHHFRDYVTRGEITIHPIDTGDQIADFLTKPVNESIVVKLRKLIMGW
jgi:Reverse transcriptase (RNA-dependent DNA polymerase)